MSSNIDMNMLKQKAKHSLHAVIVPLPAQGHVYSLMNLAELLVMRGVFVTFVNTEWIHKRMVSGDDPGLEKQPQRIRFLSIPNAKPFAHGNTSSHGESFVALQKLGPALEDLLRTADDKSPSFPPISFIVTDAFMSCTEEVASNMKVPRVIFWPICAAASVAQCYANFLLSEGHIPVNVSEAKNPEKIITCLPGNIPPLKPTDLLPVYRTQDPSDILFRGLLHESQQQSKGDYILVNTFEELEGRDAVTALSLNGCPALAIGPLFLPHFIQGRAWDCSRLEDESCLTWLDMQLPRSVIYVWFGKIDVKSKQQVEQLALGLEGIGQPFLWVLGLDVVGGQAAILPEGFEERTKDRALFVRCAPRVKVLAHASVGLYLTDNGWNSTLESMSMGVPVVGFPVSFDQFLNCRFAKEVWKIGLDFEGVEVDKHKVVMKEEVEGVIRRMMRTAEGKEMRDNVMRLKESARKAVLPGGSSFMNLNIFVKDMRMSHGLQSKIETM